MTALEELKLVLTLIRKYNLPLSPILEYAINEKIDELSKDEPVINGLEVDTNTPMFENAPQESPNGELPETKESGVKFASKDLKIVEYGNRTIAVVGDTKPHKDALKTLGGYFVLRTQWGPAWIFRAKKRERIQAYIDEGVVIDQPKLISNPDEPTKTGSGRYVIRVKYPNGSEFSSNLVWKTLVDVVNYAGPERVRRLNIICMGDNLVSSQLNENPIYRSGQKSIGRGLYVCTYSSTDTKYKQIERISQELHLGLKVEKLFVNENGDFQTREAEKLYDWDELKSSSRDTTRYSFEGGQFLSKRRFVLEVVKYYVRCHPNISYESLIRVFPASLNSNKSNGVLKRYNDVIKQIALNPDVSNRFFLKEDEIIELSSGMKVVVHNQWGEDFGNFLNVAASFYDVKSNKGHESISPNDIARGISADPPEHPNDIRLVDDKRIGFTVMLFPSQKKGKIINVRTDRTGIKKLVVSTTTGETIEINDLPYLYEVLSRE